MSGTPSNVRRFAMPVRIRFQHCDPAGIAFFARLDELLNAAFEDWCALVGIPFALLMSRDRCGFPLVHATIDYTSVLRMGDDVVVGHHVRAVGTSSITFDVSIHAGDRQCLVGTHVRVMTSLDTHRAVALPASLRSMLLGDTPGPSLP